MFLEQIVGSRKVEREEKLKYLGFVRVIALNVLICTLDLYEQVKKHSGPLKSTVGALETAVVFAVDPFYQYFKGIPDELLLFVDNKVDSAEKKLNHFVPTWLKNLINFIKSMVLKAFQIAKNLVKATKAGGLKAAIAYTCTLFMQFLLTQFASILYFIIHSPFLRSLVGFAIRVAAVCGRIYNTLVKFMKAIGFPFIKHLSIIPVDELLKAYRAMEVDVEAISGITKLGEKVISSITGLGGEAVSGVTGLGEKAISGVTELGGEVVSGITGLGKKTVSGITGLESRAVSGVTELGGVVSGVAGYGEKIVSGVTEFGGEAVSGVTGIGEKAISGVTGVGGEAISGVSGLGAEALPDINRVGAKELSGVTNVGTKAFSSVTGIGTKAISGLTGFGSNVLKHS